jgi:hypothetical protein
MTVILGQDGNDLIKDRLSSNDVFMVGRVGISEIQATYYYDNKTPLPSHLVNLLENIAGVYGNCINEFCETYLNSIKNCDMQVYWDLPPIKHQQETIYCKYGPNQQIIENKCVEPFHFNPPWSEALKYKKVLVINPFSDSIKKQYENRGKIWSNNVLPEFELITYKNVQSIGNIGPHRNWTESLNIMKEEISNIDFDVVLLGCGAYGMPLGDYIKNTLNKPSIYIGGSIQIMFGIKGNRWDSHPLISSYYNEHWVRPTSEEKPNNYLVAEGGSYW